MAHARETLGVALELQRVETRGTPGAAVAAAAERLVARVVAAVGADWTPVAQQASCAPALGRTAHVGFAAPAEYLESRIRRQITWEP